MKQLVLAVLLFFCKFLIAQPFKVEGTVIDAKTKLGVPNALVFIDQTTHFTRTDSSGRYSLNDIVDNNFYLVIASGKYETLAYKASLTAPSSSVRFELVEITSQATAFDQNSLNKWSVLFLYSLFGSSKNAAECELLNPEALRFNYKDSLDELTVTSTEPLQIINEGLGYMVTCQLDSFIINPSLNQHAYFGYTFFKNLTTQRAEIEEKWKARRKEAYSGSIYHFFKSLHNKVLDEEGFELHKVRVVYSDDPEFASLKRSKDITIVSRGSAAVKGVKKEYLFLSWRNNVELDSVRRIDSITGNCLFISPEITQVIYKKEKEDIGYLLQTSQGTVSNAQKSYLVTRSTLTVNPNGYYYNAEDLSIRGYMEWEKLSERLPVNYSLK